MTGSKEIIEALTAVLVTAGFKATKETFSFDGVPDSVIDHAFRIEARIESTDYQMFMVREADEIFSIWIAYKATRDIAAVRNGALADQEAIERAILNDADLSALDCDPIVGMVATEIEQLSDVYLVSRIDFKINYVQSVS